MIVTTYYRMLSFWARVRQMIRIARQTWCMCEPKVMIITLRDEPAAILFDPSDYKNVNEFIKKFFTEDGGLNTETTLSTK